MVYFSKLNCIRVVNLFLITDLYCCVYYKKVITENDITCMFPFYLTAFNKCLCIVSYALFLTSPIPFCTGATSAPCLIFIFPAVFYIRIVPKDKEPMNSIPKILVRIYQRPFIHMLT